MIASKLFSQKYTLIAMTVPEKKILKKILFRGLPRVSGHFEHCAACSLMIM